MRPVIFLDIDGVLVTQASVGKKKPEGYEGFSVMDSGCIDRLNVLCEKVPNALIVITSTWRRMKLLPALRSAFKDMGFKFPERIKDRTPALGNEIRGDEIASWLRNMSDDLKFVILDDDADMGSLIDHLVQTNTYVGLQDEHVEKAVAMLA